MYAGGYGYGWDRINKNWHQAAAAGCGQAFRYGGDYYHAWKPLCSLLGATKIYCIITLENHHYIKWMH